MTPKEKKSWLGNGLISLVVVLVGVVNGWYVSSQDRQHAIQLASQYSDLYRDVQEYQKYVDAWHLNFDRLLTGNAADLEMVMCFLKGVSPQRYQEFLEPILQKRLNDIKERNTAAVTLNRKERTPLR